jgi:ADP-ribosyl-[dinitrogen reductase] hydrolase
MRTPAPLTGLAIGDALGMPFETGNPFEQRLLNWDGSYGSSDFHRLGPGQWTDDTQMSMALARSLIEHKQYLPDAVARRYLDWFKGDCRGIGNSTRQAMEALARGATWETSGVLNATGNGTAMRAAPLGVFFRHSPVLASDMAFVDSRITHVSLEASEGSRAVAIAVAQLSLGLSKTTLLPRVLTYLRASKVHDTLQNLQRPELGVSAYVVETLNAAFYAFLNTDNYRDAVEMAVRFGGDTDSVASITGAMAGAHYGMEGIPVAYLAQLEKAHEIQELDRVLLEP